MHEIPNLLADGYCIFHKESAKQFGDVEDNVSIAKRHYTSTANWESGAKRTGIQYNIKFDKQTDWGMYQTLNPVALLKFLEESKGSFVSPDDLINVLQENIMAGCIK